MEKVAVGSRTSSTNRFAVIVKILEVHKGVRVMGKIIQDREVITRQRLDSFL
jgi:hypothetical protein